MTENLGCVHEACGEVSLDTFVATKARCRNRIPLDIVETNDFLIEQIRSNRIFGRVFFFFFYQSTNMPMQWGCDLRVFSLKNDVETFYE